MDNKSLENLVHHLFLSARRAEFESLSDKQLLQRYIGQRHERALAELVRRHEVMVWAICRRILGPCRDAKDVYQVTFLRLVRQAIFVQRYVSVAGWLHTVARSMAINVQRKREQQRACEERSVKMCEEGYTDPRDTKELAEILDEEVGYLPEKCQSPIILCYVEGLSPEQAARRIKISMPCLKRRLAEGRHRLHQRLSKRGINLDSPRLVAGLSLNLHMRQIPPGLTEKTLHMVRILTQSNSALEPVGISGGVTTLAKNALETWTLKAKLLLALLLVTLVVLSGGIITYSSWRSYRGEQEHHSPQSRRGHREEERNKEIKKEDKKIKNKSSPGSGSVGS